MMITLVLLTTNLQTTLLDRALHSSCNETAYCKHSTTFECARENWISSFFMLLLFLHNASFRLAIQASRPCLTWLWCALTLVRKVAEGVPMISLVPQFLLLALHPGSEAVHLAAWSSEPKQSLRSSSWSFGARPAPCETWPKVKENSSPFSLRQLESLYLN